MIFALMASAALVLVVLWQRSPLLSAALVGPLLAIALYQRSTYRALRAMRLALTDPLTGLGNHRHFHERLERELVAAERNECSFSLCLVDVDDFKRVNDLFGHPAGDLVLSRIATNLRQNGEAFRLGGDEFALLLPEYNESEAIATASSILERIAELQLDHVGSVTVSAGVATFPRQAPDRGELIRLADSALYWAKENGKNRVHVYRPDVVELAEPSALRRGRIAPPGSAQPRASPRPSTFATPTQGATRRASPSSPPASQRASASTRSRSSSPGSRAACTISASSRSPRRSSASPAP